jgi:hypothetical protein
MKNYAYIKGVLDDALEGYAKKGGDFRARAENVKDGRHMFKHVTKFPCVKQPPNSVKEAFYALHHMWAIIQNEHRLTTHLVFEDGPKSMQGSRTLNLGTTSSASRIRLRLSCKKMSSQGGRPCPAPDR